MAAEVGSDDLIVDAPAFLALPRLILVERRPPCVFAGVAVDLAEGIDEAGRAED